MAKINAAEDRAGPPHGCVILLPIPQNLSAPKKLAWGALLLLSTSFSWAQNSLPTVPQVEAAYLYNFGKFVTFPAERAASTEQFQICILGKDPFGKVLDSTVSGERIGGRPITILRIAQVQQAVPCSILFISSSEEDRLGAVLEAAQRLNLLTISDVKHFAERGGIIGLVAQKDRVRFEVNRNAAERCHLVLSSELLKVAVRVIEKGAPGT